MKIIDEIKKEYNQNKVVTGFMGIVIGISLLTYLKPGSTDSILGYIGFTAMNFLFLSFILAVLWYFFWRKKK